MGRYRKFKMTKKYLEKYNLDENINNSYLLLMWAFISEHKFYFLDTLKALDILN